MSYRLDCDLPSLFLSSFTDALQMSAVEWEEFVNDEMGKILKQTMALF
jgi:hypothetical protein